MISYENIGKLMLRIPQYKFPGYFLREGLVSMKTKNDGNLRNPENYSLTEKGYEMCDLPIPKELLVDEELLSNIERKYSFDELGVYGKKGSRSILKTNIKKLKEIIEFTDSQLLDAIDLYLSEVENKKYCRQSEYSIFKDGTFHILPYLERIKEGETLNQVKWL